ncbi:hypothetical protein MKW92_021408 [Papaver armeniacum]|nr:hypothetical protein MKW92_021408 [Papaver armeniacum]
MSLAQTRVKGIYVGFPPAFLRSVLSKHSSLLLFAILQLTNATLLDHLTSEETLLNDSYTPNSDFTPENHAFTRNLYPMSEPQPFGNSGDERNGKIVAAGYVVTCLEGEVCHHRIVQKNVSKVRIDCVYDDTAPIWDSPQGDDYFKLFSYVGGGWVVVWHKKRLQFTI